MNDYMKETMTCPKDKTTVKKYGDSVCPHKGGVCCATCRFEPEPEVGMGATNVLWTDAHAYTITRVSPSKHTFWAKRDKVERDPSFVPHYIPGGFSVHCTNDADQKWICTPDPTAEEVRVTKTKKKGWFSGKKGRFIVGRKHENYDHNF